MARSNEQTRSNGFFNLIKNLFFLMLFLQFLPSFIGSLKTTYEDIASPKAHIGYLSIKDEIKDSTYYVKQINKFLESSDIKGLILKINSPGGYPGSSQAIFNELKKFKKSKPIVALIENVGASGGYYIAAAATTIIANPSSLVGSIGVLMQLPNFTHLLESWKVNVRYVQSGDFKTAGSSVKDLTPQEEAYLQKLSDNNYRQFVKDIAGARNLSTKDHKLWADGKVFTGDQAIKLKLIDKLGSFSDARDEIKKLAKIENDIKLIHPTRPSSLMRLFAGEEEYGHGQTKMADSIANVLSTTCESLVIKQASNLPHSS